MGKPPTVYLKRNAKGAIESPWWWFRYYDHGVRRALKTKQAWEGTPPSTTSVLDKGDDAFEASRTRAQLMAEQDMKDISTRRSEEDSLKRIHEIRHGHKVRGVPLSEMWAKWRGKEGRVLEVKWESGIKAATARFVTLVRVLQPHAREMADVTEETASAFAKQEIAAYAPKTARHHLLHVQGIFTELRKAAALAANPFEDVDIPDGKSIHRKPYSKPQVGDIIRVSSTEDHVFVGRGVLTSLCTCMRQCDCCRLLWEDVKLATGDIDVIPSKTEDSSETRVTIPIFPMLLPILEKAAAERKPGEKFVFPDLAKMYEENQDGIIWRTGQLMKAAGVPVELEKHATGKRRVNRGGFSALRTTFITLGLNLGIKEELLRKVTGHAAMEIIRKYYYMPAAADVRAEMKKLSKVFKSTGSTASTA